MQSEKEVEGIISINTRDSEDLFTLSTKHAEKPPISRSTMGANSISYVAYIR